MARDVIVDFDDCEDRYDRNGINFLFYWKAKYPKFQVNMFAIPGRMTQGFLDLLKPHRDWIDLCVHGWKHDDNFEAQKWDEYKANLYLQRAEDMGAFSKVFKAPGWQITYPQPYNENPDPSKPVNSDPQLVYRVLKERGYIVADQEYNNDKRPKDLKVYLVSHPWCVHGHTWDINMADPTSRNGMRQWEEERGVPWDKNTNFHFIKDVI